MTSTFNQPNWQVSGDVYNTAGDLILNRDSTRDDVLRVLTDLRRQVTEAEDIDDEQKATALKDIDQAVAEAAKEGVAKESVAERLNAAGNALEQGAGFAEGALKLAKTVFSIAKWVAVFLV